MVGNLSLLLDQLNLLGLDCLRKALIVLLNLKCFFGESLTGLTNPNSFSFDSWNLVPLLLIASIDF